MTYEEQLKIEELNRQIIEQIRKNYTDAEINEYYFNHTKPETVAYFNLRTTKQLDKLLRLTGYDFSVPKPTLRNCNKPENKRSHESYIAGGEKSAKTQKLSWKNKTDAEKEAWATKMSASHSSEETRTLLSMLNKERFANMSDEERAEYARVRSEANLKKWSDPEQLAERNVRAFATKNANNSFNVSAPEEQYYSYLCDTHGADNVVRQYKDDRYPFACDFYIKSLDLFIELNLTWTHGGHPFKEDNEQDTNKLHAWQIKAAESKYYQQAIYTWTDLDVRKQKCAIEHNLNYVAYYSEEELYD